MIKSGIEAEAAKAGSVTCSLRASHECLKKIIPLEIEKIKADPSKGLLPLESANVLLPNSPYSTGNIFRRLRNIIRIGFE